MRIVLDKTSIRRRSGLIHEYRAGLTLVELVVVMVILVALAGIALPLVGTVSDQARIDATNASLHRLQNVILNQYVPDMKGADIWAGLAASPVYNPDGLPRYASTAFSTGVSPPQLEYLFVNPAYESSSARGATLNSYNSVTRLGWKGPYLTSGLGTYPGANALAASAGFTSAYGATGDQTVLDGWGNPIVIVPALDSAGNEYHILLSTGSGGSLTSLPLATDGSGNSVVAITIGTNGAPTISSTTGSTYHWLPLQIPNLSTFTP